jgi:hypothetical protein
MTLVGKPFWAGLGRNTQPGMPPNEAEQKDFVAEVKARAKRYFEAAEQLGMIQKWREGEAVYFMRDLDELGFGNSMATKLDLGTRKDPRIKIKVPEVRSLGRQQLAFLMAEKTGFQCVANMGETKSVMAATLADPAVNYVYDEHIRPQMRKFAERIIRYGAGATHMRWDATKGDDVIEEVPVTQMVPMQQPDGSVVPQEQTTIAKQSAKSGAPFVDALTPFEMAYDPIIGEKAGWVIAFERTNLYALAGEYPEMAEQLLDVSCTDEFESYRLRSWQEMGANDGDVIAIHFYYADRPELKGGRYALIVGDMVVLDVPRCPLKAGRLPVKVLLTSPMDECAFSFADSWSQHGCEDALNRIRGSQLTNIAYFGNQVLTQMNGTTTTLEQTSGGNQRVKTYPLGAEPPKAMEVAPMPPTADTMKEELITSMTRNSGFADASRGGSSAEKTTSGVQLAGIEAITARNLSLTQGDLIGHEEALVNDLIEMLRSYANTGFMAEVAGKEGAPVAKMFAPDDLSSVRRVKAIAVPDAMRGPLARLQLLDQTKDIEDPRERAKAVQMVLRGDDEWGKNDQRSMNLISSENERLISGDVSPQSPVRALSSDNHYAHMPDHQAALDLLRTQDNPDPGSIERLGAHIQEHSEALQQQDPVIAQCMGYPPPPILPGNPAFVFQQSIMAAQQMLAPPPPPGSDPNAPPGQKPANDQQQQGAQPPSEAAA